ncbi:MAG: prolyl-tRNA synthetase associated domain-containing protein [Rhizobiaceae bacterium]
MPLTPETLLSRLDEAGYEISTVRHPPLYTVADSVKLRGNIDGRHTKNLFLKDKKDNYFLVTLGEDRVVDLKQLHKQIGAASRLSFGKPEKLMEYLGILPGAVSAFAVVNDAEGHVEAVFDQELMDHRLINAHPLTNEATTTIATDALIEFMTQCGHAPRILALST